MFQKAAIDSPADLAWASNNLPCKWRAEFSFQLGLGETDFPTPQAIHGDLASYISNSGSYGPYQDKSGVPKLREKVSEFINSRYGAEIDPGWITMLPGIRPTLAALADTIGAEYKHLVVVGTPAYKSTVDAIAKLSREVSFIDLVYEQGRWSLNRHQLEIASRQYASIFFIVNPHNPTGHQFTIDELKAISETAEKTGSIIISDEIYEFYARGGGHTPVYNVDTYARHNSICLSGTGKALNLSGWKPSYAIACPRIVRQYMRGAIPTPSTLSQIALAVSLNHVTDIRQQLSALDRLVVMLDLHSKNKNNNLQIFTPQCGYLALCENLSSFSGPQTVDFLKNFGVDVWGHSKFYKMKYSQFRLNFGTSEDNMLAALNTIEAALSVDSQK